MKQRAHKFASMNAPRFGQNCKHLWIRLSWWNLNRAIKCCKLKSKWRYRRRTLSATLTSTPSSKEEHQPQHRNRLLNHNKSSRKSTQNLTGIKMHLSYLFRSRSKEEIKPSPRTQKFRLRSNAQSFKPMTRPLISNYLIPLTLSNLWATHQRKNWSSSSRKRRKEWIGRVWSRVKAALLGKLPLYQFRQFRNKHDPMPPRKTGIKSTKTSKKILKTKNLKATPPWTAFSSKFTNEQIRTRGEPWWRAIKPPAEPSSQQTGAKWLTRTMRARTGHRLLMDKCGQTMPKKQRNKIAEC